MFEAKYNLWKLGNKLQNNRSPPHYFIFFQKEKNHFLKIDIATNTSDFVRSSPEEIKTRGLQHIELYKKSSICAQYICLYSYPPPPQKKRLTTYLLTTVC